MPEEPNKPSSVKFNYVKSNYFRVIHADGAYGGITPYGNIFFSLYNDRAAVPDVTVQAVGESGFAGDEIVSERIGKTGIERELEVSVVMPLYAAKALHEWLEIRIKTVEKMQEEQQQQKESEVKS